MIDIERLKLAMSTCGFRGFIEERGAGYAIGIDADEVTFLQLAKFAELCGTRSVKVVGVFAGGGALRVEVAWPVGERF